MAKKFLGEDDSDFRPFAHSQRGGSGSPVGRDLQVSRTAEDGKHLAGRSLGELGGLPRRRLGIRRVPAGTEMSLPARGVLAHNIAWVKPTE